MAKRPRPPREPAPDECCGSGCTRCVWDVYYDKLAEYNQLIAEWKEPGGDTSSSSDSDDEFDDDEHSTNSESETNYIGSIVIKYLPTERFDTHKMDNPFKHLGPGFLPVESVRLVKSSDMSSSAESSSVNILRITTSAPMGVPNPGDVVELFVPNGQTAVGTTGLIDKLCQQLGVAPDAVCELHRSPFVPEDHFPPWLPMRTAMSVREILTYYVDVSSCSYLLRPTFFQSLLRIYDNNNASGNGSAPEATTAGATASDIGRASDIRGSPGLLKECASETEGPRIFQSIMNRGNSLCYPSLADVLDVFSFVRLPLERLLEISAPLRPRKFSVARVDKRGDVGGTTEIRCVELCMRKVTVDRAQCLHSVSSAPAAAISLASKLNNAALYREQAGGLSSARFRGHVSFPLCEIAAAGRVSGAASANASLPIHTSTRSLSCFIGTSLFGTSTFGKELRKVLVTCTSTTQKPLAKVFLIGAGTGIAPLMAAVTELMESHGQRGQTPKGDGVTSVVSPVHVWYGAATRAELIYHDVLTKAVSQRAISSYRFATSRELMENSTSKQGVPPPRHVTDIMKSESSALRQGLLEDGGRLFACGPAKVLQSIRALLQNLLSEADDDESAREQRVLLLEQKNQILFDIWSTVKEF